MNPFLVIYVHSIGSRELVPASVVAGRAPCQCGGVINYGEER